METLFEGVARILSFFIDLWLSIFPWRKDPHPWPHMMKNGGCFCACFRCVKETDRFYCCVCRRCNQECTGFGRLGNIDGVRVEQSRGYPEKDGRIAKRWYRP